MKSVYPIVLTKSDGGGFMVFAPDFQINTQGENLVEAFDMARDAIGIVGIDMEDDNKPLPQATPIEEINRQHGELVTLIDVDFTEYRRANEQRSVRRNVSLPSWLDMAAEKAGINVSAILQAALKEELNISN
jgi:predicted RNase H-like HicB family nuclease